ncbi:sulfotransferase 6B1-like isoform X2 [Eublepharis macularius]|uniref:Sulfotransferase n=1 Tax=Eublepharis macularius TaxID=481883 RepID=A0AA97L7G2_EUBMA|nr:sulfotransferase 6B1-like isoform X2 [Eublepharis macularius]
MSAPNEEDLIHTFNGIAFTTRSSPELLSSLATFDARDDDVLLVSYPKSVALTSPIEFGDLSRLEQLDHLSCKRIIPTHLDANMLPPTFKLKQCKAIYILRNPKDIAVSMYHYYKENPNLPTIETWSEFLEMFLKGDVVCGSWFDHILSWEEYTTDKNTLFLFYEDMKKDLPKVVKQVSSFLGVNTSESGINEICAKCSFSEMKTNTEKENYDPNQTVCALTSNRRLIFRKGAVGDWKNYFTSKQDRVFEETFAKKMKCSKVAKHLVYE